MFTACPKRKNTEKGNNDPIGALFYYFHFKWNSAFDSPVIYGVRAETSNPYHLRCIEHVSVIQLSDIPYKKIQYIL